MTRLLLVEDEAALARSVTLALSDEGYVVDHAADGREGLWQAQSGHHDAVILDLRLPEIPGLEVCGRLRRGGSRVPILILSACDTPEDIVAGLDLGADDYVTKPFEVEVFLARLRALVRRGSSGSPATLRVADLEVDTAKRRVVRADREICVSTLEYRILEHLVLHHGRVRSRAELAAAIWDDELGPDSNVLEVCVSRLRRKVDRPGEVPLIRTRRGSGYLIDGPS